MADQDAIDSLPYVDKDYEAMRPTVQALIEDEMQSMPSHRDYAEQYPKADNQFFKSPCISQELERIATGKPLNAIDTSRYDSRDPPKGENIEEWQTFTDLLRIMMESEQFSQINAELLDKYGVHSWKQSNACLENLIAQIENTSSAVQKEIVDVNKKRKSEHIHAAKKLQVLEAQWVQLVNTSLQAELACAKLKSEEARSR